MLLVQLSKPVGSSDHRAELFQGEHYGVQEQLPGRHRPRPHGLGRAGPHRQDLPPLRPHEREGPLQAPERRGHRSVPPVSRPGQQRLGPRLCAVGIPVRRPRRLRQSPFGKVRPCPVRPGVPGRSERPRSGRPAQEDQHLRPLVRRPFYQGDHRALPCLPCSRAATPVWSTPSRPCPASTMARRSRPSSATRA